MLSLRALSRALPKVAFRQPSVRCVSSLSRTAFYRPTFQPATRISYPAFSTSAARSESAGEFDQELAAKIEQEYSLELENNDESKVAQIQEYLQSSPFTVVDKPGTHEVVLTRDFGNEKIKIEFSISDINQLDADEFDQGEEDAAFDDEADYEPSKNTATQSSTRGGKGDGLPEDGLAPADGAEGESDVADFASGPGYPISLLVTITKPGDQAIQIAATAADGNIEIENINYFQKASIIDADTGKDAQEAQALYPGPPIGNLDPELQLLLERYLEERGINAELALFLPDYVDQKEQKEYVSWLENLKKFVEA